MADLFDRLRAEAAEEWNTYVRHPFVEQMGKGTLSQDAFRHYLVQDYLFLIHFARAYGLAVYKGTSLAEMRSAHAGLKAILDVEMDLHVGLCAEWGIKAEDIENAPESRATTAYTRFVLDTGLRGDLLDLHVALAPCVIGYAEIGTDLATRAGALGDGNPYAVWISEYSGETYQDVAARARRTLDDLAARNATDARFSGLCRIFSQATRLEADFWQMGLTLAD